MWKMSWCCDLNPQPIEHDSPASTTRPLFPTPTRTFLPFLTFCATIFIVTFILTTPIHLPKTICFTVQERDKTLSVKAPWHTVTNLGTSTEPKILSSTFRLVIARLVHQIPSSLKAKKIACFEDPCRYVIMVLLLKDGSGCGSVGRAVTSDSRCPLFESSHRKTSIQNIFTVKCLIDKNK